MHLSAHPPHAHPARRRQNGHSLLITLIVVTTCASLLGVSMLRTMETTRRSARATMYASAERAADGTLEYAYGCWKKAISQKSGPLLPSDTSDNAVLTAAGPTIPGYTYTTPLSIVPIDAFGNLASAPTPISCNVPNYPGWRGISYSYLASVRLQPNTGPNSLRPAPAGAKRVFQYITVPLFQAMFFFQDDLEIFRPATMLVGGLVHTNGRLLVSGIDGGSGVSDLTFQGSVSYSGGNATTPGYTTTTLPAGGATTLGMTTAAAQAAMMAPIYGNGGQSQQLAEVNPMQVFGVQPSTLFNTTDSNPNNDSFHEIIDPPVTTSPDPAAIATRRLFNKAGIVVQISGKSSKTSKTGTTVTVTPANGTTLTPTQTTGIANAITARTNIYDQREGSTVDVSNVDVSVLTPILNAASGFNGVLYIYDTSTGDGDKNTIRLLKGGTLPTDGLTVASQNPIYIQGDYNTGTTTKPTSVPANSTGNSDDTSSPTVPGYTRVPASVIGDAVMLLSNSWNDSNSALSVNSRDASNTTYNTAIISGYIPSGWDPDGTGPTAPYNYSGGANNFPRFLENWTGNTCTYYGSMVELYISKTFTGAFDILDNVYRPPLRAWNFDTNYLTNPPPGSVDSVVITRGPWMKL